MESNSWNSKYQVVTVSTSEAISGPADDTICNLYKMCISIYGNLCGILYRSQLKQELFIVKLLLSDLGVFLVGPWLFAFRCFVNLHKITGVNSPVFNFNEPENKSIAM